MITKSCENKTLALPAPAQIRTALGSVQYAEEGEGPAVLCLHGAMGGYEQGLILGRTLGEPGYRYIAPSRPGYLGTPLAPAKSPEEQADLYAALLDALNAESAAVMAISGGGPSALAFALRHPRRCRALVLASTCSEEIKTPLPAAYYLMRLVVRLPWLSSSALRKTRKNPEAAARRSVSKPEILRRTMADPEAWALFRALMESCADRMAKRISGTENDVKATRSRSFALEKISAPALVIHGTEDPFLPFAVQAKGFSERIPKVEVLALEGGEHAAIFTHRDQAREGAASFLRRYLGQD